LVGRQAQTNGSKTGTCSGPVTGTCRASDQRHLHRTESSDVYASASRGRSAFLPLADDRGMRSQTTSMGSRIF
jgi:hypothetical protein